MFEPRCLAVLSAVALAVILTAVPARAEPTAPPSVGVEATPAVAPAAAPATAPAPKVAGSTPLPTVQVDGVVWAQALVGNLVVAGGRFSNARPAGAAPGTHLSPRGNLLAYDIRTGVLDPAFVHSTNNDVLTVAVSPDGSTVYIGGLFTQVDGKTRNRIAAFSASSGALLPYAPSFDSTVATISVTSSTVYVGGSFSTVNGNGRGRLAATTLTGALRPWAPTATGTVRGLVAWPAAGRVYLGGSFSTVDGQPTEGVAAVKAGSGAWIPTAASTQIVATSNNSTSAGIYSLRTDGVSIYGTGYNALSAAFPQFEGTFSLNPTDGTLRWVNDCWGDSYDAYPIGGVLYLASHVHSCAGANLFQETGTHYFGSAFGTAATSNRNVPDARGWNYSAFVTSSWTGWHPNFIHGSVTGQSVWSFTGNGQFAAAGGEFPMVNDVAQQGLVRFAIPQ